MNPQKREFQSPSFTLASFLILIVCLSLTLFAWQQVSAGLHKEAQMKFDSQTHEIEDAIKTRVDTYKNMVLSAESLINARGTVEREEWKRFVDSFNLQKDYPGIQGIGFALYIPKGEREKHVQEIKKNGFPNYSIFPQGEREAYTPAIFIEPFSGRNLRAFGYDMFSDSTRREAMERARDYGTLALSGKVRLIQETDKNAQAGFLIYTAAYKQGAPTSTVPQRRAGIYGYPYAPFRMNDFMEGIFSKKKYDITFEVFDGSDLSVAENRMYSQDSGKYTRNSRYFPSFKKTQTLRVIDRDWTISYISLPQFGLSTSERLLPVGVLTSGTFFSFLIFIIMNSLSFSRRRAVTYARHLTKSLAESEEKYRSIFQGLFDIYYRITLEGTILLVSPSLEKYTGVPPKNAVGHNIKEFYVDPTQRDELLKHQLKERETVNYTITIRGKNNITLLMSVNSRVIRDERGKPIYIEGFMRDITEISRAQQELKTRSDQLERLNKSFIGRELKMIELKQELEKIKKDETK